MSVQIKVDIAIYVLNFGEDNSSSISDADKETWFSRIARLKQAAQAWYQSQMILHIYGFIPIQKCLGSLIMLNTT